MSLTSLLKDHDQLVKNKTEQLSNSLLGDIISKYTSQLEERVDPEGKIPLDLCLQLLKDSVNLHKIYIGSPTKDTDVLPSRYRDKYDNRAKPPQVILNTESLLNKGKKGKKGKYKPLAKLYSNIIESSESDDDHDDEIEPESEPTVTTTGSQKPKIISPSSSLKPIKISKESLTPIKLDDNDHVINTDIKHLLDHQDTTTHYRHLTTNFVFTQTNNVWRGIGILENNILKRF